MTTFRWHNHDYIHYIRSQTDKHNVDNIARTKAYQRFYAAFPEIKWAFLASMVSRNAGWNMTDLWLSPFIAILSARQRWSMFMTYERSNWLIFADAYPQLLLYQLSIDTQQSLFHLLPAFQVSRYMQQEWEVFWQHQDAERLMLALIINEQNVIEHPVIKQDYFKYRVFLRPAYFLQDFFLLNAVLLPTASQHVYGAFVHDFTSINKRIEMGKTLASIVFHPQVYRPLLEFAQSVEHTGSRRDYERYCGIEIEAAPLLRSVYPVIAHQDKWRRDWNKRKRVQAKWLATVSLTPDPQIKKQFYNRRRLMYAYSHVKDILT
ncbi:DUF2515 domain-containing protein [Barrientosiimonas marina]|uniref:DUF2515 family protein n=1 Tax=Lentibacillus kimchii TaxID=1542911 RepID=A0ABW2UYB5_9BACI